MVWLWIVVVALLIIICILLLQCRSFIQKYQKQAEKIFKEYTEEAHTLDDMAGLLEGLFEIEKPGARRICAHCEHLKKCIYENKIPASPTDCGDFQPRNLEKEGNKQ